MKRSKNPTPTRRLPSSWRDDRDAPKTSQKTHEIKRDQDNEEDSGCARSKEHWNLKIQRVI